MKSSSRPWKFVSPLVRCLVLAGLWAFDAAAVQAVDVTLSSTAVGRTPERVGYNSGHFMAGSNTAAWWAYSGVNAARVWATPAVVEGSDDNGLWGDGVATQQQFIDRRAALRADPLSTSFINWPYLENRYANNPTTGNNVNLNYAFTSLRNLRIEPVVEIHRSSGAYPFDPANTPAGWADRWEQWQHFYAQAFYLAKNFDVARYQMYNEPNHSSNDITQAEYLQRLQLASDAVQAAIADVNRLFGKSLDAQMHGPVTAGGYTLFHQRPGGDARDDAVGWGELVMENLHVNYLGEYDPGFKLIDTYAYQQYSGSASTFASNFSSLKSAVSAAAPGENLRLAITEMNVSTAANFETTSDTLDTPVRYAQMGSILAALAKEQADELYVFKFSQTADSSPSGVKKNGVHYVDNDSGPYNVGGVTKAGEVVRLFTKGFAGAQTLLATPQATGSGASDLHLVASYNGAANKYSLLSTNLAASARTLSVDLNPWGVPAGALVTIEEVSGDRHGEMRQLVELPANKRLSLSQSAQSVLLFSIAERAPAQRLTLDATDDAMVKAGGNAETNYGGSVNLYAKNDPTNPAARNVSFIKFDLDAIDRSRVESAVLRVTGENTGSADQVIAHVYGILADDWDEASITWNTAPNLLSGAGPAVDISDNFIAGVGQSATVLGHFTATKTERELMLDVTQFVRNHQDEKLSFLIAREVRWNGENVDDALTSLRLNSRESGDGPQLLLSLSGAASPADFNGDGQVDGDDLSAWQAGFGTPAGGSPGDGDADADGDVDGADFLYWQRERTAAAVLAQVPEPASIALFGAAAVFAGPMLRPTLARQAADDEL